MLRSDKRIVATGAGSSADEAMASAVERAESFNIDRQDGQDIDPAE